MAGKDDLANLDDELSEINNRRDRIDALVHIAKQEFDNKCSYEEIMHRLNLEMIRNWMLSGGTRNEYLNAVRVRLDYLYGVKLQSRDGNIATQIEDAIKKPEKRLSRPDQFFYIMRTLEGRNRNPIEHNVLVEELEKSGRFTHDEAERMIQGMRIRGRIYESRPGSYNVV